MRLNQNKVLQLTSTIHLKFVFIGGKYCCCLEEKLNKKVFNGFEKVLLIMFDYKWVGIS